MASIEVVEVVVEATCGATLSDALRESALVALKDNMTVKMTHNGNVYVADPRAILTAMAATQKSAK